MSDTSKSLAGMRVRKAEAALYEAVEAVETARRELSPIVGGLNQNCARLAALDKKIKEEIYDLERCRTSGKCDLDTTFQAMLSRAEEGKARAKKGDR